MKLFSTRSVEKQFGKSALWILAVLLFSSGVLRLGGSTGQAIALEVAAFGSSPEQLPEPVACKTSDEMTIILEELLAREKKLQDREDYLETRAQTIEYAETEYQKNIKALVQAEEKLASTIATAQSASESDLSRLTTVYENMKPKDASVLFQEMDPEFAAGFIARMRPDAAANILTGVKPETAYSISVILAGRNASVPTE